MRVSLVILTLNEIDGLRALYDRIPIDEVDEVFVVDGGSTDGTREFLQERGVRIVEQKSRGRGEAFRLACEASSGDALIFYSPDGNEDPADIPRFRPLLEEGYDVVIASRMMRGSHNEEDEQLLRLRKWVNNALTLAVNLWWNRRGSYVTDTINGYRAITRQAFRCIWPESAGYTIEYESSIRALKLGLRIAEFPTHEGERIGGESYATSLPTGLAMLRVFAREAWIGKRFGRDD
jgi:glycosyltransferase involved in cell wall biosynthesis